MSSSGKVYLVGAGPGDPGLITLRGAECLREADLVLYDGLVNPLLLRLTRGICERTARTSREHVFITSQEEINARLISEARAGRTVVRLKGGDPYIFGRGSEEAAALHEAEIEFEVVPGITAATAAAEYAGISYTHRDFSSAVALITGHEDAARSASRIDYHSLATFPGTLVFYMGLNRISEICERLKTSGMAAGTPAAVVCHASLASQQCVTGTLGTLPALAAAKQLKPPSLIVVGQCVTQRPQLSWFDRLPLSGLTIGITRAEEQADSVIDQVVRLGAEPVLLPMIRIASVDAQQASVIRDTLHGLQNFDWLVFTSSNGVSEFFRHLSESGRDARALHGMQIACIGSSTAERLLSFGLKADLVPEEFRAEALAAALAEHVVGKTVLWACASRGRDVLPKGLQAAGAICRRLVVYQNLDSELLSQETIQRLKSGTIDWIGLSSPSIARRFSEQLQAAAIEPSQLAARLASISPVTSTAATECGLSISAEAEVFTWDGILAAIAAAHAVEQPASE